MRILIVEDDRIKKGTLNYRVGERKSSLNYRVGTRSRK